MINLKLYVSLLVTGFIFFTPSVIIAQRDIRTERIQFRRGTSSTVVSGSIRGYEIREYVLNAKKGQYMNISMATDNSSNYFNILEPGEDQVAIFNSSMAQNQYEGTLAKSGDYKIRVYMMRNAARRNEIANYRLETIVTGRSKRDNSISRLPENPYQVGNYYNATAYFRCSIGNANHDRQCPGGIVRRGNGNASVVVKYPNGYEVQYDFDRGNVTSTFSDNLNWGKSGDEWYIGVDRNLFIIIPNAAIYGG